MHTTEQVLHTECSANHSFRPPPLVSFLQMELILEEHVCVSHGWSSHVSRAGTSMGHTPFLPQVFMTAETQ